MCKSTGDKELALIVFAEFHHHVFAKGRTGFADIHSHIEHTPFDYPYEFGLGKGPFLVVQTTKNAIRRLRLIVLNEFHRTNVRIELLLFPSLHKITSCITEHAGFYNIHSGYFCL